MKSILCAILLSILTVTAMADGPVVMDESRLVPLEIRSSYDGKTFTGLLQLPDSYDPSAPAPLLVWLQGMYRAAKWGLEDVANAPAHRGWLTLSLDARGDRTDREHPGITDNTREKDWDNASISLGAHRAQRDTMDALNHVLESYNIDPSRIYIGGSSPGALTAGLVIQNFPDRWAGGALVMTVVDMADWYAQKDPEGHTAKDIVIECGGTPEENPEEYARRSLLPKVEQLARVPLVLCHGTEDSSVPPSHCEKLVKALIPCKPLDLYVYYYEGGHDRTLVDMEKICDYLERFSRP